MSARASFGRFELDLESGTLSRDGVRIRLQPQPARVLVLLVQQAGSVVSRETLRQQVWPEGTFVDFERGLNFCIAQVRGALGDSADSPRFIETLPRRGYRFIAPVGVPQSSLRATSEQPESNLRAASEQPQSRVQFLRTSRWLPVAGLAFLAIVTAGLIAGTHRAVTRDPTVRVAVVPFDNETGMDDFDRIARGVADATVARLAAPARIGRISVIGNAAALHQPRRFRDLKRIGLELGADYIVLAQMKRDAAQVRLIAHLIRVADEAHVWANTFDAPEFTLDVQGRIAETIAASITTVLTAPSSSRTRS
jgi:DNA-binding winged helix-turn-helix (wHTH) protein/TolB-like protein